MLAYVVRRLLLAVPTLLGILLITFFLFYVVAEDPAKTLLGPKASPDALKRKAHELGTDRSLGVQFVDFLADSARLEFGDSWKYKRPVGEMLLEGLVPSLSVTFPAFLLALLFALSLSLFCAFYRNSAVDRIAVVAAVAGLSISSLLYIIFGQYFLAYRWNLFPIFGYELSARGTVFLVLPWIIWIALSVGGDLRFFRTVVLEEMRQDYVRTAAAKGLGTRPILFRHILRNSLIPVITHAVITVPFLFVGSLLLERFFGVPGLGAMSLNAINQTDWPVIKAMVVLGSMLYILFNLLSDVLYAWADPRVRLG